MCWTPWGVAQALAGKRDEGIATLRLALNIAPTAALVRLHLAEQLTAAGDSKGATAVLAQIDAKQLSQADQALLAKLGKSGGQSGG